MTRAKGAEPRLRQTLEAIVDGAERRAAAERLSGLLTPELTLSWVDELAYAAKQYLVGSDDVDGDVLADLARIALADWAPAKRWRTTVPADVTSVRARWRTPDGVARAVEVAASLDAPSRLEALAFGRHEGRADLRGFVDPRSQDTATTVRRWLGIDFAGSKFRILSFDRALISDCRLDGASFGRGAPSWPGLSFRSSAVVDCSFVGADLNHAFVYGRRSFWRRQGSFQRVDFTAANLGRASFHSVAIEDCNFADARLYDTEFQSDMARCRFSGEVEGLMVYGQDWLGSVLPQRLNLDALDFTQAHLRLTAFRFVDMRAVRLPTDANLLIVDNWPCIHKHLSDHAKLMTWEEQGFSLRSALSSEPKWTVGPLWRTTIELEALRQHDSPGNATRFLNLLAAAQAECRRGAPASDIAER